MTTNKKAEQKRGFQQAVKQFAVLRTKWPKAFPAHSLEVRPLASGTVIVLTDTFGWSHHYARAVLATWKLREAYCRALLDHAQRINLDGSASDEHVDDAVRKVARQQLDGIAARAAQKAEKLRVRQEREAQHQISEPGPASMLVYKDVSG
jgi:sRNA-binding protein